VEAAIQKLAALFFFVIGVSHVAQPRAWAEFFIAVRGRGPAVAGFVNAFIHFPLGALIVAFHDVWTWPGVALTLIGWGLVLKGFLSFVYPRHAVRQMERVSVERAWEFAVAGAIAVAFAGFCVFLLLRDG
jgi:uncharacterized protein YjeT (DUF2065 family)